MSYSGTFTSVFLGGIGSHLLALFLVMSVSLLIRSDHSSRSFNCVLTVKNWLKNGYRVMKWWLPIVSIGENLSLWGDKLSQGLNEFGINYIYIYANILKFYLLLVPWTDFLQNYILFMKIFKLKFRNLQEAWTADFKVQELKTKTI